MFDVVGVGEMLIDFTPNGTNEQGSALFAQNPGGAPANVLATVARLGGKAAFIGKVGEDGFGRFLHSTLLQAGVEASGLSTCKTVRTTLAFVQLDETGERSFSFYRNPGADLMLEESDIKLEFVQKCDILHFGGVSLTGEPARSATLYAAKLAKEAGKLVSYDPNYRPLLWENQVQARSELYAALAYANILKVSSEELELLSGTGRLVEGARRLTEQGPALVFVSLGAKGAFYYKKGGTYNTLPTYDVPTIDTNGAGDAFFGAVLYSLCGLKHSGLQKLTAERLDAIVDFANACGALATTKYGSIPALPTRDEIQACRRERKLAVERPD